MTTYQLFDAHPGGAGSTDGTVTLGTEFFVTQAGCTVTQIRWARASTSGPSTGITAAIFSTTNGTSGTKVAGDFTLPIPAAGAWGTFTLPTPLALTANTRYRVAVRYASGGYVATANYFINGGPGDPSQVKGPLTIPNRGSALGSFQGSFSYFAAGVAFPDGEFNGSSYWSDVTVDDGVGGVTVTRTPADTLALTDSVTTSQSRQLSVAIADTLTITDTGAPQALDRGATISDALTLTDQGTRKSEASRAVADTVALTDAVTAELAAPAEANLADTVTLNDSVTVALDVERGITDSLNLTDDAATDLAVANEATPTDTLALADEVSAVMERVVTVDDFLGLTDATQFEQAGAGAVAVTDTLTSTDAVNVGRATAHALSDTLSMADVAVAVLERAYSVTIGDTLAPTDKMVAYDPANVRDITIRAGSLNVDWALGALAANPLQATTLSRAPYEATTLGTAWTTGKLFIDD